MTAHELARKLLEGPDLPITIWGGIDGDIREEVNEVVKPTKDDAWFDKNSHLTDTPSLLLQ